MTDSAPRATAMHQMLPLNTPQTMPWGADMWVLQYRRYLVFSWPWLWRRTLLWASWLGVWGVLSFMSYLLMSKNVGLSAKASAMSYSTLLLAHSIAPILATFANTRWRESTRANAAIVIAVSVGFVIALTVHEIAYIQKAVFLKSTSLAWVVRLNDSFTGNMKLINEAMKYAMYFGIFYAFGGGHALWAYFRQQRRLKDALEAQKIAMLQAQKKDTEMRLGVLQAQVEPHFLFNTLAVVRALVRTDAERAEATLDALVDYLRATIPKLRDGERQLHSTLGQQIDLCESYLEVMRLRSGDRLRHAVDVEPALLGMSFPPMLLITLVENAIKHGIEPKPGPGRVVIAAERMAQRLRVTVRDDGVGLQPGLGGGLGLANVRAQLDALYGGRATFSLESAAQGGVCASLDLPLDEVQA